MADKFEVTGIKIAYAHELAPSERTRLAGNISDTLRAADNAAWDAAVEAMCREVLPLVGWATTDAVEAKIRALKRGGK